METLSAVTKAGVEQAVKEWDAIGGDAFLEKYGFGQPTRYTLFVNGKPYAPKAIVGVAYGYSVGRPGDLPPAPFSGGEKRANKCLRELGFDVQALGDSQVPAPETVETERTRRMAAWSALSARGGPTNVSPALVRELGLYGGAQGIWVDADRTKAVANPGVTVGVSHRGTRYADDIWEDGLLYHYPSTNRQPGRDAAEIEATKWAKRLALPIFVSLNADSGPDSRNVRMAWVEDWDDADKVFLIDFGSTPPAPPPVPEPEAPFVLEAEGKKGSALVETRLGQQRFKIKCVAYYGATCAVCDLSVRQLLDGAHIRPKKAKGSDDPRNGLILCAIHHRAFDAGFFVIEPESLEVQPHGQGPGMDALRVTRTSLRHLARPPHPDALRWAWDERTKT